MGGLMLKIARFFVGTLLACCPIIASQAKEKPQLDLSAYPEASPERSLPEIMKGLRRFLKDSASITDFALCKPVAKFKIQDGSLKFYTYLFSLNSKNAFGGYTGVQHYAAIFRQGKPVNISLVTMPGDSDFAALANMLIEKDMRKCDFLPNEDVQKLLQAR
jgi:hypothetical protein